MCSYCRILGLLVFCLVVCVVMARMVGGQGIDEDSGALDWAQQPAVRRIMDQGARKKAKRA